ncbi:hypothetical protein UlMin_004318 [Ulmus minor]
MKDLSLPPVHLPTNFINHHHYHQQPQIYGRDFKRSGVRSTNGMKRSIRAPRMRWTTTLHPHFVHALQLLGGHERNQVLSLMSIALLLFYLLRLMSCLNSGTTIQDNIVLYIELFIYLFLFVLCFSSLSH